MLRKLHLRNIRKTNFPSLTFSVILLMGLSIFGNAQITMIEKMECDCLDYPDIPGRGQFEEEIILNATPGQTIRATGFDNFFDPASAPGDFDPLPDTVDFMESPAGTYSIEGIRREGKRWSFFILQPDLVDEPPLFLESDNNCRYPDNMIYGDTTSCIGNIEYYEINIDQKFIESIEWTLSGGGSLIELFDSSRIGVAWGDTPGTFQLSVEFEGIDGFMNPETPCMFTSEINVTLTEDEESVQMACNNEVNLSVSGLCELMVTPEIILKDLPLPATSFDIELTDLEADTIVNGNMVYGEYIGKRLGVSVIHDCSRNSCWGTILIEDKAAPFITCLPDTLVECGTDTRPENLGFPVPEFAEVDSIDNRTYRVLGFDLCGPVILTYQDEFETLVCDTDTATIITRTFIVTDMNGLSNSCSYDISIMRSEFEEIVFPEDYDDEVGTQPSLMACGDWEKLENGAPAPSVTGMPEGALCLGAYIDFEDKIFAKCGEENIDKVFKVWRRWQVIEECPDGTDSIHVQIISVRDTVKPEVTVPDTIMAGTDLHSCTSDIDVPVPIINDCLPTTYSVGYRLKSDGEEMGPLLLTGVVLNSDSTYTINDIPADQEEIWIVYTVVDACGNDSIATTEVIITDDVEPVAVCDQFTIVSLDEHGMAHAGYESFNDGSWDNCSIDSFDVRRMEETVCGVVSDWGPKVTFCCDDVGKSVVVALRVFDKAGNSNTCMVEVEVQDNIAPIFLSVPKDTMVDCAEHLHDLSRFGIPIVKDKCGARIDEMVDDRRNDCGIGEIERKFTAIDSFGNTRVAFQIIDVKNLSNFNMDNIDFPDDYTVSNQCLTSTDPDSLPTGFGYPQNYGNTCIRLTYNYKDQEFLYTEGSCKKIIRTWTAIDWCTYDESEGDDGVYIHHQVIKIQNSVAPVLSSCGDDPVIESYEGCEALTRIEANATDDCTPESDLVYSYKIDLNKDGTHEISGTGKIFLGLLPFGTHSITWLVSDGCLNTDECTYDIEIEDLKLPTPICFTDLVTVIMPTTGTITLWAKDFNKGSFDNCLDSTDIRFSFSSSPVDSFMTYTCDDLNGQSKDTLDVEMYVIDAAGNSDFCTVHLIIQDNAGICIVEEEVEEEEEEETNQLTEVSGGVNMRGNQPLSSFKMSINSSSDHSKSSGGDFTDGEYAFNEVQMNLDYQLLPSKEGPADEGVSTLDLLKIQRHIIGIQLFDKSYEMIAADVNNDERVAASDIIQLRKLILGIYSEFPQNSSWRFVRADFSPMILEDIFPFPETISITNLSAPMPDQNFMAVKIGDVDNSLNIRESGIDTRERNALLYSESGRNNYQIIDFRIDEQNTLGLQCALFLKGAEIENLKVTSSQINHFENFYSIQLMEDGVLILISWDGEISHYNTALFSIEMEGNDDLEVTLSNELSPEIYLQTKSGVDFKPITLEKLNESNPFSVDQNYPNPFQSETFIRVNLEESIPINLRVFDLSGRTVYSVEETGQSGINRLSVKRSELGAGGVYYYSITAGNATITKKMIVLD